MNIECIKEKLSYAISKAERITGKNITLPILSCILLEAHDSVLTIKATNLDLGIEITLPVKVIKPGKVAVSGAVLYNFILNITNDKNITLEVVNDNLKVSTKHNCSTIKTFPTDDFPNIPKVSKEKTFTFNVPGLIKGFKSVMYSSSVSTIRPVLSSIFLSSEEEGVVFVATDSFRLSEKKIGVKKHKEFNQILIPFKNTGEIIRTLEDIKEDVEVCLNENQIAFSYNDLYITSRVIDGVFPDYKQIIPKDTKTEVVVLKQDLISSLRISNIFSDKFSQVTFHIHPKEKIFEITTKNMDVGENINNIDAVIKGEELSISFNYKYIIDCFQSIDSDSVSLSFSDTNKPMIVRGVGDKSFLYLVMPMNK
ncbi:MAG: DNA polymerase III subunit beta [Candidatus Zambryskibacteria bacterium]|nr:DNA polymerase III subunit beta [Candidatus Zambryskibacteria bacterium]